jgi:hypothetical protein
MTQASNLSLSYPKNGGRSLRRGDILSEDCLKPLDMSADHLPKALKATLALLPNHFKAIPIQYAVA